MALTNFRKETSERSDEANWAKSLLIKYSGYHLDSIEGCNQNADNMVTHLIERARVDYSADKKSTKEEIIAQVKALEGEDILQRKINFASCYQLPLSYALYCNENERVYLLSFLSLTEVEAVRTFKSYQEFADWIAEIKGWKSNKAFREIQDLPDFDKALRNAGTPWPTNIDCFISDNQNKPIAVLEFQNARNTSVVNHCNNDYFLCLMKKTVQGQYGPYTVYHDDIRRWTSQEILRVQSGLRFLVITWAQAEEDFILKEIEVVTIPFFPQSDGKPNWKQMDAYKADLNRYVSNAKSKEIEEQISKKYKTYNIDYSEGQMNMQVNEPPTSYEAKTFPSIYYRYKELVKGNQSELLRLFSILIQR
jgi:hypothetical protein